MHITRREALKEIRAEARRVGLVFKQKNVKLNDMYLHMFVDKRSGNIALDNCQFWTAYEDVQNGFIATFNSETGRFERSE